MRMTKRFVKKQSMQGMFQGTAILPESGSNARFARTWLLGLLAAIGLLFCSHATAQTAVFSGTQSSVGTGLANPNGVAVDGSGNVYIADTANSRVVMETVSNDTWKVIGSGLQYPTAVAVDSHGNVYIADNGNSRVLKETLLNGSYTQSAIFTALPYLSGLAVDGSGNLYIAYSANLLLKETLANGSYTQSWIGSVLNSPAGVAVDGSGNVYIADANNGAVYKETLSNGNYTQSTIESGMNDPHGVAVDGSGNVYIAALLSNQVFKETLSSGSYTQSLIGSGLAGAAGVAVDSNGNVYIADEGNNRVLKVLTSVEDFGAVNIGSGSETISSIFTFTASGAIGAPVVMTQGAKGLDFADAGTGSCNTNGAYIYNIGDTCTVDVTFTPRFAGYQYGAAEIVNSLGKVFATAYLQGTGNGPQINFLPGTQSVVVSSAAPFGLSQPQGVAVDGAGNLYIADYGNFRVVKETLSSGGHTQSIVVPYSFGPISVAVDGSGNVYIGSSYDSRVIKETLSSLGTYTESIVTFGEYFVPSGVAVDSIGNVYIADLDSGQLSKETLANGIYTKSIIASNLNNPMEVAVDSSGNVYVADAGNSRVVMETLSNGSYTQSTIGSGMSQPEGVAVDGAGDVYVADNVVGTVWKETLANGVYTQSTLASRLSNPVSVAVDGGGNVYIVDQGGNRVLKEDLADAPRLSFASTVEGSTSSDSPQTVTVSNIGNAILNFPLPTTGSNPSVSGSFLWDASSTCLQTTASSGESFELYGGTSCTMAFDFKPLAAGSISGSAVLADNSLNVAGATQTMSLGGTGLATAQVSLSATSLTYGLEAVGAVSGSQQVTLTNTGGAALSITSIALTGSDASSFVFGNTCGASVAGGASCIIHGHFAPAAAGALNAAVTITDSASNSPQSIALSGIGVEPPVTLSATSLSYGSVKLGTSSGSQSVTLTNNGIAALSISSIAVTGANASSFVFGNTCGTSLPARASCTIHGHFAPTATGALKAALTITDSAGTSPQSITLSGTGVPPSGPVTLSATSLSYPSTTVGTSSGSQSVIMTNTGTAALMITSVAVTGTDASSFVFANSCGTSLAMGASCTIHGHFAPTAIGSVAASVTITDSATSSPQSIALSGTGQ